jgi:hypothetical protein
LLEVDTAPDKLDALEESCNTSLWFAALLGCAVDEFEVLEDDEDDVDGCEDEEVEVVADDVAEVELVDTFEVGDDFDVDEEIEEALIFTDEVEVLEDGTDETNEREDEEVEVLEDDTDEVEVLEERTDEIRECEDEVLEVLDDDTDEDEEAVAKPIRTRNRTENTRRNNEVPITPEEIITNEHYPADQRKARLKIEQNSYFNYFNSLCQGWAPIFNCIYLVPVLHHTEVLYVQRCGWVAGEGDSEACKRSQMLLGCTFCREVPAQPNGSCGYEDPTILSSKEASGAGAHLVLCLRAQAPDWRRLANLSLWGSVANRI